MKLLQKYVRLFVPILLILILWNIYIFTSTRFNQATDSYKTDSTVARKITEKRAKSAAVIKYLPTNAHLEPITRIGNLTADLAFIIGIPTVRVSFINLKFIQMKYMM